MVDVERQLLERKVKIVHKNGFIKTGILKKINDRYIALQLYDGKIEIISFEAIDTIKEDTAR